MNHLFNKIKPVGKRVIIAIDTNEKNTHKVVKDDGTEVELFVNTDYSWDSKITAYTQAVLLTDFKNLKAGTHVLIHHNSLNEGNKMEVEYNTTTRFHSIEEDFVYFGLDGDRVICLDGYMLIDRIYDDGTVTPAGLILVEKKKEDSMFRVLDKPDSITDYEIGDIAIAYKYSDYEINCKINGKMQKLIRLKYSDCLAKA